MYDQTGSTDTNNPFSGFEQEDFFRDFGGGHGGQGSYSSFQDLFSDLFGGGMDNARGKRGRGAG